ncbi:MAG: lysylphosphatidylglycerol synthase transmembrane domain-containing protein [Gemmatimonadales bacterium]
MSRRAWVLTVLAVVACALSVRFGARFPWSQTMNTLVAADWVMLAGAGLINIVSLMAKAGAWHVLLRRLAPVRASTAQVATFIGAAVSSISVSVSGEAARAQTAGMRDGVPFGLAVASLAASRVVEGLGLFVFLALALMLVPPWPGARAAGLSLGAVAVLAALCYPLMRRRSWHPRVRRLAGFEGGGLAGPVVLAGLSWVAQWITYHWSIVATHASITPAVSLAALVLANVAGILRLTPGNIGVVQGSIILGMGAFEIPAANALAAGLALQAVQVIPILVIGIAIVGIRGFRRLATRRMVTA